MRLDMLIVFLREVMYSPLFTRYLKKDNGIKKLDVMASSVVFFSHVPVCPSGMATK